MPALKKLRGAAHDLAHHSQSALGWLHPHLAVACRRAGVLEARIELLAPDPYPKDLPILEPLQLALKALRAWFLELLVRLGHDEAAVQSVIMTFHFRPGDDYNSQVRTAIAAPNGKTYAGEVDYV